MKKPPSWLRKRPVYFKYGGPPPLTQEDRDRVREELRNAIDRQKESAPENDCCLLMCLPITSCHNIDPDTASRKYDLWCCECSRFWKGSKGELVLAQQHAEQDKGGNSDG